MADTTAISWCDATFNPWWGCQKVSPACDHCYAERDAKRFAAGTVLWGVDSQRRTFDDKHWAALRKWAKRAFVECPACSWRGMHTKLRHAHGSHFCPECSNDEWRPARMRVFCASMGDWLDLHGPLVEFVRLLDTIRLTPELDWLLLSKRIGNFRNRLTEALAAIGDRAESPSLWDWINSWLAGAAPAHVWVGATVINQAEADRDIAKLLAVPARVRFLSIEPMLDAVTVFSVDGPIDVADGVASPLHWVIAGGESGPKARPAHPDWFRSLRDQCAAAGVPFHFKQWGEWLGPLQDGNPETSVVPSAFTSEAAIRVGKKAAGRLLDGIEHNGFPAGA